MWRGDDSCDLDEWPTTASGPVLRAQCGHRLSKRVSVAEVRRSQGTVTALGPSPTPGRFRRSRRLRPVVHTSRTGRFDPHASVGGS